jgi:sugar (glycoside-pentoside-hexuronide) transporter
VPAPAEDSARGQPRLTVGRKVVFATGDFTVNTVLSSLSMVFTFYFLIEIAGLRPALAGLVPLVARTVDAITDPLMGRISDHTRWKRGRRRPYFLLGAIPFGVSFALLWADVGLDSQTKLFAYYTSVYVVLSLAMTVLSVPYLALMPEMATSYDGRTSLNIYRNVGSVLGVFAAILLLQLANLFGGGADGFARAGALFGVLLAVPWFAVYARTFENPEYQQRAAEIRLLEGLRILMRHRTYLRLMGLYLSSRIAMDLVGAMLLPYFTYYLGRAEDFQPMMFLFLLSVVASLPFWQRISIRHEKSGIFIVGSLWWMAGGILMFAVEPGWPRWVILGFAPVVAIGYAVTDLMPWAMIGEVVDEDDVATGERREGLYNGSFTFLRKLGGMLAVAGAGLILDAAGLERQGTASEVAGTAVRFLVSLAPALFLLLAVWLARGYPLTRARHGELLEQLAARDGGEPSDRYVR